MSVERGTNPLETRYSRGMTSTRAALQRGRVVLLIVACMVMGTPPARAQAAGDAPSLVTVAELARRLDDPALVLLQVSSDADYAAGHLRGARHVTPAMLSTPRGEGRLTLQLPDEQVLRSRLASLGITDASRVVVYHGGDWVSPATRVVFTLDAVGLGGRTQMLDGGLAAWKAAGHPVTTEATAPVTNTGDLTLRPRPSVITFDEVKALARETGSGTARAATIVDARATDFYTGASDGRGSIPRPGHIPGAVSLPFTSFFTQAGPDGPQVLKPRAELEAMFAEAGIAAGTTVVTYCHIGQQATVPFLVARMLGYDVRLYDGSFEEWSADATVPVER
jgi:thiosulfate/3-mercaptopyruvate sulfurtransferase